MFAALFRERRRSVAVHGLVSPATRTDPCLDRYVGAAAHAFDAPIAMLSLIHGDRQSIRASHGLAPTSMRRADGLCGHALDRRDVLECCDPEADDRFAALPLVVGDPWLRYYIGAPLTLLSGVDIGTLCVVDIVPRPPASADQKAYLRGLARQASMTLETRLDLLGDAP